MADMKIDPRAAELSDVDLYREILARFDAHDEEWWPIEYLERKVMDVLAQDLICRRFNVDAYIRDVRDKQ